LLKKAEKEKYSIFEDNIRSFLGTKGAINSQIIKTLNDKNERINFLYYNNGITIIADEIETVERSVNDAGRIFMKNTKIIKVKNPQIVNGCQTVNSIYHVLKSYSDKNKMWDDFEYTFVMVKLLQLSVEKDKKSYINIVKYNNSQNGIKYKDILAAEEFFTNLHNDLKSDYGFFLLNKQSHSNDFNNLLQSNYVEVEKMYSKAKSICDNIYVHIKQNDLKINLEKLLLALLAYHYGGYSAYMKKSELLKEGSNIYNELINKIYVMTRQQILSIYLCYLRSEISRKQSKDKKTPVTYYLLTFLKRIHIDKVVLYSDVGKYNECYSLAEKATRIYMRKMQDIEPQYNKMIKEKMNDKEIEAAIDVAKY